MIFFVYVSSFYVVYAAYVYIYTNLTVEQKPTVSMHIFGYTRMCVYICLYICVHARVCVYIYVCVYEKQMHCRQIKQINIDSNRSISL